MFYNKTPLLILAFCSIRFSCLQEKRNFINVLNLNNSPDSPKDEGLNVFFDLGSWMGFSLSNKETNTGFSGPYILGLEHGIWSSKNFTSIDLISENGNSLLTNLYSSEQKYFPLQV